MNHGLPEHLNEAVEEIDAAIFSGDTFNDPEARKVLRDLMARWTRGLDETELSAITEAP